MWLEGRSGRRRLADRGESGRPPGREPRIGRACHDERMPDSSADLPGGLSADGQRPPHVVLVVGDEEFLVARAVEQVATAARRVDPSTDIDERAGGQVEPAELFDLLSPSLFGGRRVLVISAAQDLRAAALTTQPSSWCTLAAPRARQSSMPLARPERGRSRVLD